VTVMAYPFVLQFLNKSVQAKSQTRRHCKQGHVRGFRRSKGAEASIGGSTGGRELSSRTSPPLEPPIAGCNANFGGGGGGGSGKDSAARRSSEGCFDGARALVITETVHKGL
jgi:hypothetical protein